MSLFQTSPETFISPGPIFLHRTTRFVYDAKKEIDRRDEMATESGEVTENDEESEATEETQNMCLMPQDWDTKNRLIWYADRSCG